MISKALPSSTDSRFSYYVDLFLKRTLRLEFFSFDQRDDFCELFRLLPILSLLYKNEETILAVVTHGTSPSFCGIGWGFQLETLALLFLFSSNFNHSNY